jgi:sigma-B regulation protein RsbU (phosphoserine phosphatase)
MRILVVDDESFIRDLLVQTLEPLGYEVTAVSDGQEALRLVEHFHPDIMILDVSMPGLDGYQVLDRLRPTESDSRIFVLMLTARAELEDLERGLGSGADDYLPKPFQLRELVARINAAVRVQTLQKELRLKNQQLAEANLALAASLKVQERLNQKMNLEMEMAARLQSGMLSPGSFNKGKIRASARYQPSAKIGGDFYDLRILRNGQASIFLADAVGHGVSAALLAAMAKMALEEALAGQVKPARVLSALNRSMQFCSEHGKYLTAFFGLLNCDTGDLTYSLAGHVPPILYRASGQGVETLDSPGLCLGIFEEGKYEDRRVRLCQGDRLFAFTDGIYDASPDDRQLFGSRFPDLLVESAALTNEDFLDRLDADLAYLLGGERPADDYTLLSIQCLKDPVGGERHPS